MSTSAAETPTKVELSLPSRLFAFLKRRLYLALHLIAVIGIVGLIYLYVGHRNLMEALSDTSRELLTIQVARFEDSVHENADFSSGPQRMRLNGQLVHIEFGSSHLSPQQALEARVHDCERGDGAESSDFQEGQGYVACLSGSGDPGDRIRQFAEHSRLGALGELEFSFVTGGEHSSFVTLKPSPDFDSSAMFPADGQDVPGEDPVDLPRPLDSLRTLDLRSEMDPYAITVFRSEVSSLTELQQDFERRLDRDVWREVDTEIDGLLTLQRRDNPLRMTYVSFTSSQNGPFSVVAFAEAS